MEASDARRWVENFERAAERDCEAMVARGAVVDEFAHALDDRTRPEILRGVLKRLGLRR